MQGVCPATNYFKLVDIDFSGDAVGLLLYRAAKSAFLCAKPRGRDIGWEAAMGETRVGRGVLVAIPGLSNSVGTEGLANAGYKVQAEGTIGKNYAAIGARAVAEAGLGPYAVEAAVGCRVELKIPDIFTED